MQPAASAIGRGIQRAVVWDLDGVLVDSSTAQNASWVAMAKEFNVPYDPDRDFPRIFGLHNTEILRSQWGVTDPETVARMVGRKEAHFRASAGSLQPLPGAVELVAAGAGWRQAVGSSAPLANVRLLLDVTGLAPYLETVASGDDVQRGKPDPEVFLLALQRLGVEPRAAVVIEDAPVGVLAAKRAGAACLAVTSTRPAEALWSAGADQVTPSLEHITPASLALLIRMSSSGGSRSGMAEG
jgi:beta-phosphoglucomutase